LLIIDDYSNRTPCKTFKLAEIISGDRQSTIELLNLMRDEQQGLSFVKDASLPEYTFVAIEATWWSIEHSNEIKNESAASELFQVDNKK
jgi:hypothetical protein